MSQARRVEQLLAEWREAERQLKRIADGERAKLEARIEALRAEYMRLTGND